MFGRDGNVLNFTFFNFFGLIHVVFIYWDLI